MIFLHRSLWHSNEIEASLHFDREQNTPVNTQLRGLWGYNKATQLQTGALIPRATSFKIPLQGCMDLMDLKVIKFLYAEPSWTHSNTYSDHF